MWQPIETAPKDGRVVLFRAESNRIASAMAICFYRKAMDEWVTESGGVTFFDATHWMPLPEAPNMGIQGPPKAVPLE